MPIFLTPFLFWRRLPAALRAVAVAGSR